MASSTGWAEYGFSTPTPSMTIWVAVAAAAVHNTGADRKNRSCDTQTWSNPAVSARMARSTKAETGRSLFRRMLVRRSTGSAAPFCYGCRLGPSTGVLIGQRLIDQRLIGLGRFAGGFRFGP